VAPKHPRGETCVVCIGRVANRSRRKPTANARGVIGVEACNMDSQGRQEEQTVDQTRRAEHGITAGATEGAREEDRMASVASASHEKPIDAVPPYNVASASTKARGCGSG